MVQILKADDRTRTDNLLITNQLLCQLSHIGIRLMTFNSAHCCAKNDSNGIWTRVTAVKGRCLNRLTNGPYKSRRLPIFTRRFQRTILGTSELNFCVRNGNRWNLTVIVTDQYDWFSITFLFYFVQCFLKDVPSKLNNHCSHFIIDLRIQANCGQALDLLVHTCWMDHSTYTSCLSTL